MVNHFFLTKELGIIVCIRNLTDVNLIVNNYRIYIKIIIYIKNCTKVSISEKIDELEKSLAPPIRPRYQARYKIYL